MKKFLINCSTNWCGNDAIYRAEAESEEELWDVAKQLAYDNFSQYDFWLDIAQDQGYDPDDMTDEDWDNLSMNTDESEYYEWTIEPFEGSDEEWELYGGDVYNAKSWV